MKNIIIYCASGHGRRVLFSLDEIEYKVVGFMDTNEKCTVGMFAGLPIIISTQFAE